MYDEEVADDGDNQLGHPIAAAEERTLFHLICFLQFVCLFCLTQNTFEMTGKSSSRILVLAKSITLMF